MQGISTITQKGQVAIPKSIRNHLNLNPNDKLHFSIRDNKIVAEPITSIKEMRGFVKTKKVLSKTEMKQIIKNRITYKYAYSS